MLSHVDLSCKAEKREYKAAMAEMEVALPALQRKALEKKIGVLIIFEGWDAAGKGTLINELILPLDPRGFKVHSILPPNENEKLHPFLWRFWFCTPARGRIAILDRSWYGRVLDDRVCGLVKEKQLSQAYEDIKSLERQLSDDGTVIIKFFLHISKKEQKKRFKRLRKDKATAWRVSEADLKRHKRYDEYFGAADEMLTATDVKSAPWTVVEAHDQRFASMKIFSTVIERLKERIEQAPTAKSEKAAAKALAQKAMTGSVLSKADLSLSLDRKEYKKRLEKGQETFRELEYEIYRKRVPVVIVYEGWDAAGKGGNIRRLIRNLDPRGYEVVPVAAPNDVEKAHHYLWRFWTQMPKAGHITLFDRSWYGRVMVERVEGFCSENEWKRAYHEINEMEAHLANFGGVVVKFWLHIDQDEQLRRFKERQQNAEKQWKITEEDWRNRKKWREYKEAVDEMIHRTSTPHAPWTIVESKCKWYARVKCLETVNAAIKKALKGK